MANDTTTPLNLNALREVVMTSLHRVSKTYAKEAEPRIKDPRLSSVLRYSRSAPGLFKTRSGDPR